MRFGHAHLGLPSTRLLASTCVVHNKSARLWGPAGKPVDRGGSVGSDEPPRLHNGRLKSSENYYTGYF